MFQEAILALRALNMLNTYVKSLSKSFALNMLVHNNAHGTPGDIVDSSSFATVMFVGHSSLNSTHSLDVYLTILVDLYVCGQRDNSMFSKRLENT